MDRDRGFRYTVDRGLRNRVFTQNPSIEGSQAGQPWDALAMLFMLQLLAEKA